VQIITQPHLQKDSHHTSENTKEASAQWEMAQNLGVTCEGGDAMVVTIYEDGAEGQGGCQ